MHRKGIVILAAGSGTRLGQNVIKALAPFMGMPLISHLLKHIPNDIPVFIIINPKHKNAFQTKIKREVTWVMQDQPLGTGHAVKQALPFIDHLESMIVLCGDTPLIPKTLLDQLLSEPPQDTLVAFEPEDTHQYGLIRPHKELAVGIDEPVNHTGALHLAYSGLMELTLSTAKHLNHLAPCPIKHEYYLTQLVSSDTPFKLIRFNGPKHLLCGINTAEQKNKLMDTHLNYLRDQINPEADIIDKKSLVLDSHITIGQSTVGSCVTFKGSIQIGDNCVIEHGCVISDCTIDDNAHIRAHSALSSCHIGSESVIGPFAHIHQSSVAKNCTLGNFVEVKRSKIGAHTKAKHLCYLGDTVTESYVNIGAGVITCNYNPLKKTKHQTTIGPYAQIGANTCLIAPINIAKHTVTGANSTLNKDTKAHTLLFNQRQIEQRNLSSVFET